jgi:hypothetical protein
MSRLDLILVTSVIVAASAACGPQEPRMTAATTAVVHSPEELGRIGAEINRSPERADEILSQRSLDPASFEREVRRVSEDQNSAQRYAESFRQADAGVRRDRDARVPPLREAFGLRRAAPLSITRSARRG